MKKEISQLEPKSVWKNFSAINAIPRASKKEQQVSDFMVAFGQNLGLETSRDKALNVLIKKPASPGFENRKKVTLQSHLDMVHQKNNDTKFDFTTQGIEMYIANDWVTAKGTTLGADNGMGVAAIMSILEDKKIQHPALEALFTIDEETGMTGAFELTPNFISGDILLNLDTEEDHEITIGCAGGIDITAKKEYTPFLIPENQPVFKITLNGLQGGHSGMDIHKGLGNANLILVRFLYQLQQKVNFQLISFSGGNLRNAIPREAEALISPSNEMEFTDACEAIAEEIRQEWSVKEPNITFGLSPQTYQKQGLSPIDQHTFLQTVYSCHNGVYTMDAAIANLVATSNNLASVTAANGTIEIACLTRSSIETEKKDLVQKLSSTFDLGGFEVQTSGSYPGWQPKPHSEIVQLMSNIYQTLFNEAPEVNACHAGLECGIIGEPYPTMEMVSFGPTIRGAHSPDEKVSIPSVQKFWCFLQEILKNIPVK